MYTAAPTTKIIIVLRSKPLLQNLDTILGILAFTLNAMGSHRRVVSRSLDYDVKIAYKGTHTEAGHTIWETNATI